MVRLWLSREHAVSIREQLSAQLLLGIVSRRLAPGERLPSVRELARRLGIHANTVSAAYRDLAARGWVSKRRGSGVYVREGVRAQARQI
jgi:GntR family transcriptional regulator / MocR family aminotransferase